MRTLYHYSYFQPWFLCLSCPVSSIVIVFFDAALFVIMEKRLINACITPRTRALSF